MRRASRLSPDQQCGTQLDTAVQLATEGDWDAGLLYQLGQGGRIIRMQWLLEEEEIVGL